MDPLSIILTIAACVGGLVILYFIIGLISMALGLRALKKADDDFFKRGGSHFRR